MGIRVRAGLVVLGLVGAGLLTGAAPASAGAPTPGCTTTQTLTINNASTSPPSPAFGDPGRVAVDAAGNVYVADSSGATVYGFDASGAQFLTINNASVSPPSPAFIGPGGVAVDGAGNVYVAGALGATVYGFDASGAQFLTINNASVSPPSPAFIFSAGVAVDESGNVYVADFGSDTVYQFDVSSCLPPVGGAQPDAAVRVHDTAPIFGEDVYGDASGQTVTKNAARGQTVVFDVKVQNDGSAPDSFRLDGDASIAAMKVTYVKGLSGSSQITVPVVNGTYVTPVLEPGAATTIRLKVTVQSSAKVGSTKPFYVTATSVADGTTTDTVRAQVTVT
jgi:hypothetical protein